MPEYSNLNPGISLSCPACGSQIRVPGSGQAANDAPYRRQLFQEWTKLQISPGEVAGGSSDSEHLIQGRTLASTPRDSDLETLVSAPN